MWTSLAANTSERLPAAISTVRLSPVTVATPPPLIPATVNEPVAVPARAMAAKTYSIWPFALTIMSIGAAVFELPTLTRLGMLALFSWGASILICLLSAVTAEVMVASAKMPSSRKLGFQVSTK